MTEPAAPLIVKDLIFRYWRRDEPAIKNLNFTLHPGQVMLIAGDSGCGKTTLMRCVNGVLTGENRYGNLITNFLHRNFQKKEGLSSMLVVTMSVIR